MLYDAYHRLVYGIALRVLSETRAAEDVTQAVFLKLWSTPEAFGGGHFAAWLARVTRNRAIDVLRDGTHLEGGDVPATIPNASVLEDDVIEHFERRDLRRAIDAIPPEQREPIELAFFAGLSHVQIARQTGVPLGTVKTRIRAGLHKLRAQLEGAIAR